jgi:hypothetical protein
MTDIDFGGMHISSLQTMNSMLPDNFVARLIAKNFSQFFIQVCLALFLWIQRKR